MNTFKVISSNPNKKEGFVTKIQRVTQVETFVGTKEKKETYYVSGPKQLTIDTDIAVNLDDFRIQEHELRNPETGEKFMGKWLHVK